MSYRRPIAGLIAASLLSPEKTRAGTLESVVLQAIPHVVQKPDFCGEACAQMVLEWHGSKLDQDDVFDFTGLDPALGRGAHTRELARALERIGFDVGPVWTSIGARDAADLEAAWSELHRDLRRGVPSRTSRRSNADYAQHVMTLKEKVPSGFSIVVEPPFVVVGDEPEERVRARAAGTVRWAVERLEGDFFDDEPEDIIDIWLFEDRASYERNTRRLFGETPSTPYGYYSPTHRALIMNIATGGGTLVHEIVHPFMEANFPGCPSWFNEGLGSLYEQSADAGGHIRGLTNWRLAGLQEAIRAGAVPSFEALTSTTRHQFYEDDPGTNYAQARYLLYYLQEKELLVRYYRELVANRNRDPTGYRTLRRVLEEKDMTAFQRRWEELVLRLRFPG